MISEKLEYSIGIDIGGTHLRIGIIEPDGSLRSFRKLKSKEVLNPSRPIDSLISFLKEFIEQEGNGGTLLGIGIGFPSVVSKDKKSIHSTPSIDFLSNINITDPLEAHFDCPVLIENDVNYLLQYEISHRNLPKDEIILGFYVGTGFGNSIYLNNQFLQGKNGAAGELGHIPALGNKEVCQCGNIGCVETRASGRRLTEIHEQHFKDSPFNELFALHADSAVVQDFVHTLALPIATEINIFDPHRVIVGGGVVGMEGFPKEKLEEYVYAHTRKPFPAEGLNISYAEDTDSAGTIGAGMSIHELKREKTNV